MSDRDEIHEALNEAARLEWLADKAAKTCDGHGRACTEYRHPMQPCCAFAVRPGDKELIHGWLLQEQARLDAMWAELRAHLARTDVMSYEVTPQSRPPADVEAAMNRHGWTLADFAPDGAGVPSLKEKP